MAHGRPGRISKSNRTGSKDSDESKTNSLEMSSRPSKDFGGNDSNGFNQRKSGYQKAIAPGDLGQTYPPPRQSKDKAMMDQSTTSNP